MPEPAVVVERLQKLFAGTTAVDDLSLTVAPGEIYGLLGPNGAGKTTTLRILAALLAPTAGRAAIAGIDVAVDPRGAQRHLGFLTGTTGLYGRLSGREALAYFGALHGMRPDVVAARTAELARRLDLGALLDRRCEALSTGQRQRVSVARAVLHDPAVLILDEPTSGLDVLASRFLRDYVRAERDRGKAVVFSTHYLAEAELLCDRIGLLYRGRLLAEGTPAALKARAASAPVDPAGSAAAATTAIAAAERGAGDATAPASSPGRDVASAGSLEEAFLRLVELSEAATDARSAGSTLRTNPSEGARP